MRIFLSVCLILFTTACTNFESNEGNIEVIAHRGSSAYAPEHTIESYELADKQGANYIEIDLRMTKDNVLIAMHDDSVNRTTNGEGEINQLTLDEIKLLDAGSWFNAGHADMSNERYEGLKVQTLDEIINHFGKNVNYYIETKQPEEYPRMDKELLIIIEKHKLSKNVVIQSFSKESLNFFHENKPELTLIQLGKPNDLNLKEISKYANGIGPSYEKLTKEFIDNAHEFDLLVHTWTVNDKKEMNKLFELGVDAIFTDYPDRAKSAIETFNLQ